jgi:tetratricopeptide (TPR) repeat protein
MTPNFKELKQQLIKGKAIQTLESLSEIAKEDLKDKNLVKELSILQFRWERIESEVRQNIISYDKASITKNQVTKAIIDVMDTIQHKMERDKDGAKPQKKKIFYLLGGLVIIALLTIAYFKFFNDHDDQHGSVYITCPFHIEDEDSLHYNILIVPFKNYSKEAFNKEVDIALREGLTTSVSRTNLNTLVRILKDPMDIPDYNFAKRKMMECNANMLIWGSYEEMDSLNIIIKFVTDDILTEVMGEGINTLSGVIKSVSSLERGEIISQFEDILGIATPLITGINLIKERQLDKALAEINKIDTSNPKVKRLVAKAKGDIHLMNEDFDKAIDSYQNGLTSGEEDPVPYNNIGYAYYKKGDLEEAWKNFKKASELQSDNSGILDNFEQVNKEFNQLNQSGQESVVNKDINAPIEVSSEAEAKLPTICGSFKECNNEGHRLLQAGKSKEALKYLNASLAYNTRYAEPYLNIGKIYNDQGDYDRAIFYFKKAESIDPDYPNTYFSLYTAYYNKGDQENARKYDDLFSEKTSGKRNLVANRFIN